MKISQLDYSAMMNANSARQQSESNSRNNRTIAANNANNAMNNINIQKSNDLAMKISEINSASQRTNAIANLINNSLNVVKQGVSLANTIYASKLQSDTTEANNAMIQATNDLNTYIVNNTGKLININDDGTVSLSDDFKSYIQSFDAQIANSKWDKSVKQSAYGSWAKMAGATAVSIMQNEVSAYRTQSKQNDQYTANELYSVDIAAGGDNPSSYISYWEGKRGQGLYSNAEIDGLIASGKSKFGFDKVKNSALGMTMNGSFSDAMKYIDESSLSNVEKATIKNLISQQNSNNKTQLSTVAGNLFSSLISQGGSIADSRNAVREQVGYSKLDKDAQMDIDSALNIAQTNYVDTLYPTAMYSSWSQSRLKVEKEALQKNKFLFEGIESSFSSRIETIDKLIDARNQLDEKLTSDADKALSDTYTSYFGTAATSFKTSLANGTMSPVTAMQNLEAARDESLDSYRDSLAIKNKEGQILKGADGNPILTEESKEKLALFRISLNKDYETERSAISTLTIPSNLKDYASQQEKILKEHFIPSDKKKKMSEEELYTANLKEQKAYDYIVTSLMAYSKDELTADKISSIYQKAIEMADMDSTGILLDIGLGKTSVALEKANGKVSYANMKDAYDTLSATSGIVYEKANGGYEFSVTNAKSTYEDYADELSRILKENNIIVMDDNGNPKPARGKGAVVTQPSRIDGNLTAVPEIIVGNKTYRTDGRALYFRDKNSSEWQQLMSLDNYKSQWSSDKRRSENEELMKHYEKYLGPRDTWFD